MKKGTDIPNLDPSHKLPHHRNGFHGLPIHSFLRRSERSIPNRLADMVIRTRRRPLRLEMVRPCTCGIERTYLRIKRERYHSNANWYCTRLLHNWYQP